jgi:adenylate cyclase class 2
MQEIEAKFYVKDLKRIENHLRNLNAHLIQSRTHETNIRFDTPNHDLRRENRVLRLRQDDKVRMTYKGASENDEGVLSRTEIEFTVEDFEKAKNFLESLGYVKLLFYEKYRTTYEIDDTHIMLDELPIGDFIEIEGENLDSIRTIADKLGINWDAAIATSYSALFERVKMSLERKMSDLSFEEFRGIQVTSKELGAQPADD